MNCTVLKRGIYRAFLVRIELTVRFGMMDKFVMVFSDKFFLFITKDPSRDRVDESSSALGIQTIDPLASRFQYQLVSPSKLLGYIFNPFAHSDISREDRDS